jgi:hypothetical protein
MTYSDRVKYYKLGLKKNVNGLKVNMIQNIGEILKIPIASLVTMA